MAGKRGANGAGTIRKKSIVNKDTGKQYTYWEARYTLGADPGTGKQVQKSVTGKTQKEVLDKLRTINTSISTGTYMEPSRMTTGQWLDIWLAEYTSDIKPLTHSAYSSQINKNIKPHIGSVKLSSLGAIQIQKMYNDFQRRENNRLSAKSIKNIHGVLHRALNQAVKLGYLSVNPSGVCELPRVEKAAIKPLDEEQISVFTEAIKGHRFERIFLVGVFTGMRQGEILGLSWDDVDMKNGVVTIKQQLIKNKMTGEYYLGPLKNDKTRYITPAPTIIKLLKEQQRAQAEMQLRAGAAWNNKDKLVFTNEIGNHLVHVTVYKAFKAIAANMGLPEARFHDLRHSYAVASIQSGDDIKTVQENLGHHTAAFTLDVYGHVTEKMKRDSADRMEAFIKGIKGG